MEVNRFEDPDLTRKYTYTDYLTWQFEERVELLRGWVARMGLAPRTEVNDIIESVSFPAFTISGKAVFSH